jgi:hypothetical protein
LDPCFEPRVIRKLTGEPHPEDESREGQGTATLHSMRRSPMIIQNPGTSAAAHEYRQSGSRIGTLPIRRRGITPGWESMP